MSIRTLLVDDHLLVMHGIKRLLEAEKDILVIDIIHEPSTLINSIPILRPDVVVMDIHMQRYNGLKLTQELQTKYPEVKVMILSGYDHEEYYNAAIKAGAMAYITKEKSVLELATAIRQTHMGYVMFPKNHLSTDDIETITPSEIKVLGLIAQDMSNFEISKELQISKRTVEYHISSIIRKLGVESRVGAVVKGIKKGLIDEFIH